MPSAIAGASAADMMVVDSLRARLSRRQETLHLLRKRIAAARSGGVSKTRPLSSVGDISRRFMMAAAESEARAGVGANRPVYVDKKEGGGVGSLMNKWNQGFAMKEAEREKVSVRGNVGRAKDVFTRENTSLKSDVEKAKRQAERSRASQGSNGYVAVQDDDVPAWAINQSARVVKKEDPRARTGTVDVSAVRGNIVQRGSAEVDTSSFRELAPKGNVGGAIAMWGQKAEDQEARERAEALRAETMKSLRADIGARSSTSRNSGSVETVPEPAEEIEEIVSVESYEDSDDDEEEPTDIRELVPFLEARVEKIDKKISRAEEEMERLEKELH